MKKLLIITLLLTFNINAQDTDRATHIIEVNIPHTNIIDIETTNQPDISFRYNNVNEAGLPLETILINNDLWINYTNISPTQNHKRQIQVSIENPATGNLPQGMDLNLLVLDDVNLGNGDTGNPTNEITLTNIPTTIIKNIGSAYTGDGANRGHNLIYRLDSSDIDFRDLVSEPTIRIVILYTLMDQ